MRLSKGILLLGSFSFIGLTGCANMADSGEPTGNDEIVDSTSSELRALQDNEKLGTIAYGESRSTSYTENPLYRAYSFSGRAGDTVDISVRSTTATDALAFLLAADYSTLASNDNANSGTKDARIVYTLQSTATYWIAFREANQESATFTVSLNGGGGTTPGDVFDPATCSNGTPFSKDYALRYYEPGANTSSNVANFRTYQRKRQCNKVTGCAAWQDNPNEVYTTYDNVAISTGYVYSYVSSDSAVHLAFKRPDGGQVIYTGGLGTANSVTSTGWSGYPFRDNTAINQYWSSVPVRVSTSCLHAKISGSTISSSSSDYVESEVVFYATTIAPPH